jgi:hypothetical protein
LRQRLFAERTPRARVSRLCDFEQINIGAKRIARESLRSKHEIPS